MKQRVGSTSAVVVAIAVVVAALVAIGKQTASAAAQATPVNTEPPAISGDPREGESLTASTGTWTGAPPAITYTYQWQRCDAVVDDASCTNIPGETASIRVITDGDVGHRLRVRVTATNTDGTATASSNQTDVIVAAVAPAITTLPAISGTARVGQTLTADRGVWSNNPTSYSYQWQRCNASGGSCTNIPGETSTIRIVTAGDLGGRLRVVVTASNAGGSSSANSAPTDVVQAAGAAPANTAVPTINGTTQSGQTLTASNGTWSNNPTSFTYQWQRCNAAGSSCVSIPGETRQTRVVANDDVGSRLRVLVTASNATGSAQAASALTEAITTGLPAGAIRLPSGQISVPVSSVSLPERLIISGVRFSPAVIRSRAPFAARFRVTDTRGYAVRDALVFSRMTPLLTTTPAEARTGQDGWVTLQFVPRRTFPLKNGYAAQFFVRARKDGDNLLAGVSTRRLVQVRTARPR